MFKLPESWSSKKKHVVRVRSPPSPIRNELILIGPPKIVTSYPKIIMCMKI